MGVGEFGQVDGSPPSEYRKRKFGPGDPWNQFGAELDRRRWVKNNSDLDGERHPVETDTKAEML
jgi:hypothetical protein